MSKIKIAIVGVGNCASSLVQGLQYYGRGNSTAGLISPTIAGYRPADVEVVAAFDVDAAKVGLPLGDAIYAGHNCTRDFCRPQGELPIISRGPTLDGLGRYLKEVVEESSEPDVWVTDVLQKTGAQVVVNYLPVGSEQASRFYADAAIAAGCGFVNCVPVFLASGDWGTKFKEAGLPIVGDDIKSQVGATIVHRALAELMHERGVVLKRTSQLNVGGNTDFLNMLERERLKSKKISKTQAVTSVMGAPLPARDVHVGPSDHVAWLDDQKWAHIFLEGEGFGGAPMRIELKLEVHDSPNSAGVVMDAIRYCRVALDRGDAGPIWGPAAYLMKSPPLQAPDARARAACQDYLDGDNGNHQHVLLNDVAPELLEQLAPERY